MTHRCAGELKKFGIRSDSHAIREFRWLAVPCNPMEKVQNTVYLWDAITQHSFIAENWFIHHFKRRHSNLFNDIKILSLPELLADLLYTTQCCFLRERIFGRSINGPKNTLTSHLVPHFRDLCKKLETNGLAINKVHMCNILKRVVHFTSLLQKWRKLTSVTRRAGWKSWLRSHAAEDHWI